jgi:4-carboxymuconolactone decarboxylase
MPTAAASGATLVRLDDDTRALVRLAAVLAGGSEDAIRREIQRAAPIAPHQWIEELLLQTYLFAGFPRALNGMREWRRVVPEPAASTEPAAPTDQLKDVGEATCAQVYGTMYERLRVNIRALHPLLDDWMIVEGYGKVLSRPGLDLQRRELCIVAACVASAQDRQLQSHLHGARNVGVAEELVTGVLDALDGVVSDLLLTRANRLWHRIRNDVH